MGGRVRCPHRQCVPTALQPASSRRAQTIQGQRRQPDIRTARLPGKGNRRRELGMGFTGNPHGSPTPHLSSRLRTSVGHARILASATRSGRKWRTALPVLAMLALVLPGVLTACGGARTPPGGPRGPPLPTPGPRTPPPPPPGAPPPPPHH